MKKVLLLFALLVAVMEVWACEEVNETVIVNETVVLNETLVNETLFVGNESNGSRMNESVVLDEGVCEVSLEVFAEKQMYNNSDKVKFYNKLSDESFPFKIEYWVEDAAGDVVKNPVVTQNTKQKSFTPRIKEKEKVFVIKSRLVEIECQNKAANIESEFVFVVVNPLFNESVMAQRKQVVNLSKLVSPQRFERKPELLNSSASKEAVVGVLSERNINIPEAVVEDEVVYISSGERAKSKSLYFVGVIVGLLMVAWVAKYEIFGKSDHRSVGVSSTARR
ncbi:MAG TPA: hypothetical protein VFE88_04630 [Candidatus Nanoarchaeia archaeon]|nr:hypothetical protein [Candidatus Nanoarchaeia archaeon]